MPVEKETQPVFAQLQVRQQLCCVNWEESLYHFVLEDNATIDEHVNPVSCINVDVSIMNWKGHLTFDLQTA